MLAFWGPLWRPLGGLLGRLGGLLGRLGGFLGPLGCPPVARSVRALARPGGGKCKSPVWGPGGE
eukprot:2336946-Pyramimonas_sp.AAC.1